MPGPVGYLQIDAHLDTAHEFGGALHTMASPVARAVERPNVSAANVAIVGVRGGANSFDEIRAADELGVRVFSMEECDAARRWCRYLRCPGCRLQRDGCDVCVV